MSVGGFGNKHLQLRSAIFVRFTVRSGYVKIAIENGPVEIVSVPINSMVISHSYVNVYQR